MAKSFDSSQQEELAKWETGHGDNDILIGVYKYKGGEPKMGINKYYVDKNTGEVGITKAGRLSYDDVQFLESILPKVIDVMAGI